MVSLHTFILPALKKSNSRCFTNTEQRMSKSVFLSPACSFRTQVLHTCVFSLLTSLQVLPHVRLVNDLISRLKCLLSKENLKYSVRLLWYNSFIIPTWYHIVMISSKAYADYIISSDLQTFKYFASRRLSLRLESLSCQSNQSWANRHMDLSWFAQVFWTLQY